MFVLYPLDISQKQSSLALRLGVGLGFGLGIPFLLACCFCFGWWESRRDPSKDQGRQHGLRTKRWKAKQNGEARNDEIGLQDLSLHREK